MPDLTILTCNRPIKVVGIKTFEEMKSFLSSATEKDDFILRFMGHETWRINPSSEDTYRAITEN